VAVRHLVNGAEMRESAVIEHIDLLSDRHQINFSHVCAAASYLPVIALGHQGNIQQTEVFNLFPQHCGRTGGAPTAHRLVRFRQAACLMAACLMAA
jgi:hypothetical protein